MTDSARHKSPHRVLVLYTGGTIGMRRTDHGYEAQPGLLAKILATLPALEARSLPEFEIVEFDPVIDSANMTPDSWNAIAALVHQRYDDFAGFVVLHGTDTMAYTASALAFALQGLTKPVVVTGSQLPLDHVRNDGRSNLFTSLEVAATSGIPEVVVLVGMRILRGCRTTKVDTESFEPFESPNYPPLATIGVNIKVVENAPQPRALPTRVWRYGTHTVLYTRLFPGFSSRVLDAALDRGVQAIVLEVYGAGTAPQADGEFTRALQRAENAQIPVIVRTQCAHGSLALSTYAAGVELRRPGIINARDMTAEAVLTKILFGLSNPEIGTLQQIFASDLRGEVSLRTGEPR